MKRLLVLLLLVGFVYSTNAQSTKLRTEKANTMKAFDLGQADQSTIVPFKDPTGIPIGQAPNVWSILLSESHQVMYNSDLNTIIFGHRGYQIGSGSSGELAFDFSTDGGATWTTNVHISPGMDAAAAGNGLRYPNFTIFNPDGNTDPAQARVVAHGPSLCDVNDGWGWTFEIDATIEETPSSINEYYGSRTGNDDDYMPYGTEVSADGTVWSIFSDWGDAFIGNIYLCKAVLDGDAMSWTSPVYNFTPDYFKPEGENAIASGWDITTDPNDANHLYMLVNTCLVGDGQEAPSPHVWEQTEAGGTWTLLPAIDFTAEPFASAMDTLILQEETNPVKPYCSEADITVDANGNVHVLVELISGSDQWGYVYTSAFAEFHDGVTRPTRHMVDFWYDGTEWHMVYIAPEFTAEAPWTNDQAGVSKHQAISRSEDGQHIIYTWCDSPNDADTLNKAPDIFAQVWDVNGNTHPAPLNVTEGTSAAGICFFPKVSPIVKTIGSGSEKSFYLPMVIPMIDYANGTDADPFINAYLHDYTIAAPLEINESPKVGKPAIQIFPNPTSDEVFITEGNKVEVFNVVGERVFEGEAVGAALKVDMKSMSAGTYIFKVHTGSEIVTQKVIKK